MAQQLFDQAKDQFLASLSSIPPLYSAHFEACDSGDELLQRIQALPRLKNKLEGVSASTRVVKRLQSYFKVIDAIVQVDKLHSSTLWGGIHLTFQLLTNYTTFTDKFISSLYEISAEFPIFDRFSELVQYSGTVGDEQLKDTLVNLYVDLLEYLFAVIRIFFKDDGRPKSKPALFAKMFWTPFETLFSETLSKMQHHRAILGHAIRLADFEKLDDMQKRLHKLDIQMEERALRDSTNLYNARGRGKDAHPGKAPFRDYAVDQIRAWVNPSDFDTALIRARKLQEDGTTTWLLSNNIFQHWKAAYEDDGQQINIRQRLFGENTFWLHGNPGYGKTVLAGSVVNNIILPRWDASAKNLTTCYFFFESAKRDMNTPLQAYRAILAQILQQHQQTDSILHKYSYLKDCASRGQQTATEEELLDLLNFCCSSLKRVFIILDGVDECVDHGALISAMLKISAIPSVRLAFFSRPNVPSLLRLVPPERRISVKGMTIDDIRVYLSKRLSELLDDGLLPDDINLNDVSERLLRRAAGMFLWAKLMISYLSSHALTINERLEALEDTNLPEGLDEMYGQIIGLVDKSNQSSRTLARRVITWILYGCQPLNSEELHEALVAGTSRKRDTYNRYQNFEDTLVLSCAGLVDFEYGYPRLIHLSLREYLIGQRAGDQAFMAQASRLQFIPSPSEAHMELALACVQYLTYHLPAQPLSGEVGRDASIVDTQHTFPFCAYASCFWITHIYNIHAYGHPQQETGFASSEYNALLVGISSFLAQKLVLMTWIEACYTHQSPPLVALLRTWAMHLRINKAAFMVAPVDVQVMSSDIEEFCSYLDSLRLSWESKLLQNPGCIWEEVTVFNPSRFLPSTTAMAFRELRPETQTNSVKMSKHPLKEISQTTPDGNFVSKLGIWPSAAFESVYHSVNTPNQRIADIVTRLCAECGGWTATYEVYQVDNSSHRLTIRESLPADEVFFQLEQSLWLQCGKLVIQFPISISQDGYSFTILRTVHNVSIDNENTNPQVTSATIPLDGHVLEQWDISKRIYEQYKDSGFKDSSLMVTRGYRKSCHNIYTYWTCLSPDNRYICFTDQICGQPNSIAVFSIKIAPEDEAGQLELSLVAIRKMWLRVPDPSDTTCARALWDDRKDFAMAFHPYQTDLVIGFYDGTGQEGGDVFNHYNKICIWDFERNTMSHQHVKPCSPIKKIRFSDGGQYAICEMDHDGLAVIPIQKRANKPNTRLPDTSEHIVRDTQNLLIRPHSAVSQSTTSPWVVGKRHENGDTLSSSSGQFPLVSLSSNYTMLSTGSVALDEKTLRVNTRVTLDNEKIELRLPRTSGPMSANLSGQQDQLLLARLPAMNGFEHAVVDVKLPQTTDDHVKIILNKGAQPWSDVQPDETQFSPAILYRDQRSFRRCHSAQGQRNGVPGGQQRLRLAQQAFGGRGL
ncbi:hypothetical protein GGI43DRAFT_406050 [Trichoderma evansii]